MPAAHNCSFLLGGNVMAATARNNMLSATDKKAALDRIGYYRFRGGKVEPEIDHWNVLNWFVGLAKSRVPFREMPTAAVELLTQEYRALQEENRPPGALSGLTQNLVTLDKLEEFRTAVRKHAEEITNGGM